MHLFMPSFTADSDDIRGRSEGHRDIFFMSFYRQLSELCTL